MHPLSSWLTLLLNLSLFLPNLVHALKFINPPSIGEPLSNTDYSLNPVYAEGSLLHILWDEQSENTASVTLWQLNGTEGMQPFEHITQDVSGSVTSFTWPVQTNKNLTFSSTFYLNFFRKGPGQNYALSTSQPSTSPARKPTTTRAPNHRRRVVSSQAQSARLHRQQLQHPHQHLLLTLRPPHQHQMA